MPANIRVASRFPFPALVNGAAPISLTKLNGVWTISLSTVGLAVQTPAPANYPNDYIIVYDSAAQTNFRIPLSSLYTIAGPDTYLSFLVRGVNFNSANTDTPISIPLPPGVTNYHVSILMIANASQTLTTATFGLFTAAAGGGVAIIPAATAITVASSAANTNNNSQTNTPTTTNTQSYNATTLFFRVGTAEGAPATGDIIVSIRPL
jgi:hypothetical protein